MFFILPATVLRNGVINYRLRTEEDRLLLNVTSQYFSSPSVPPSLHIAVT